MGLFERVATTFAGGELPEEARAELDRALAAAERGELEEAVDQLTALAQRLPRSPAILVALGDLQVRRRDDEAAVAAFGRAVDVSVDAVDAWLALGEALVRLRRGDPARDAF